MQITYLSDQVQNCLIHLFYEAYNQENTAEDAVAEVCIYLSSNNNSVKYNEILNQYINVDKNLIKQMILSNFLEITYFRRKNNIPLDNDRLGILNAVESVFSTDDDHLIDLLKCNAKQFYFMVNDTLVHLLHPSKIYAYNVVKTIQNDGFDKTLHEIYPLSKLEHVLTLDYDCTEKEFLWQTFSEVLTTTAEKSIFSKGGYTIPGIDYKIEIADFLLYDGENKESPNLHKEIFENFNYKVGIKNGMNYDKILILELLISIINSKKQTCMTLDANEKVILNELEHTYKTIDDISKFYDQNGQKIISSLINGWNLFDDETVLLDTDELSEVKNKSKKYLKKHFN